MDEEKIAHLLAQLKQRVKIPGQMEVVEGIGGFAAVVKAKQDDYLVACADGVGTKIELYLQWGNLRWAGWDCVAMCVDDLVTTGAEPFAFLDYFASSTVQPDVFQKVLEGVLEACHFCQMALIGGETAEMPGFYSENLFDMVGFAIGWVKRERLLEPKKKVRPGNLLLGIPSTGLHSNGFSLVRRLLAMKAFSLEDILPEEKKPLGEILTFPTRIYAPFLLKLLTRFPGDILGLAHITGGGIPDNLVRILPVNACAMLYSTSFSPPPIFSFLQKKGNIPDEEMWKVFK
ncbi:MAG: phosphoribosylformylglycinamidine cyclo-ligase, partial [bacterium]